MSLEHWYQSRHWPEKKEWFINHLYCEPLSTMNEDVLNTFSSVKTLSIRVISSVITLSIRIM